MKRLVQKLDIQTRDRILDLAKGILAADTDKLTMLESLTGAQCNFTPGTLSQFNFTQYADELQENAPVLVDFFQTLCSARTTRKSQLSSSNITTKKDRQQMAITSLSIVLYAKSQKCNYFQKVMGLFKIASGLRKQSRSVLQ